MVAAMFDLDLRSAQHALLVAGKPRSRSPASPNKLAFLVFDGLNPWLTVHP